MSETESSRPSSRLSAYAHSSTVSEAESDVPERPKATKKTAKHPYLTKDQASGGSNTFLTAAERRVQDKKAEKKSSEDPFYFLQDVRDKDGVRPGQPGYDPRTLYIPPQAWKEFTPFEKQVSVHNVGGLHNHLIIYHTCSSGKSSKIISIQYYSFRKANF